MEAINGLLTTARGDSAAVRIVIDLDSLAVVIRDEPVAQWPLAEIRGELAAPEVVAVSVPDESFMFASPEAERLVRLLRAAAQPEPASGRCWRPGRHRRAGLARDRLSRIATDARRKPPDPVVWWLAVGVFAAIVLTVWSIAG